MTDPTPAAGTPAPAAVAAEPAASAAPAAPAAPAATPAAAEPASLIPADPAAAPAPAPAAAKPDPNAPAPVAHPEWFLADGTKGEGAPPAWYKADKYKSVAAQAEAYSHLEKKLGAFTGAPKDGKYEFKLPEGIDGEFDIEHPMYKDLTKAAAEMQISNEGFNTLMGMFAKYEASIAPNASVNLTEAKKALGDNADSRISATALWAQANLAPEVFKDFRAATNAAEMSGEQIARVVRVVEAAMGKTRVQMPKPGADVPAQTQNEEQELQILLQKKDGKGNILYFTDAKHRELIDRKRVELANKRA